MFRQIQNETIKEDSEKKILTVHREELYDGVHSPNEETQKQIGTQTEVLRSDGQLRYTKVR